MKIVFRIVSSKKRCVNLFIEIDIFSITYVYVFQTYFYMGINTVTRQHNIIPKVFKE